MKGFRNSWFEFAPGASGIHLSFAPGGYFDPRPLIVFCLGWGRFFLNLPFRTKYDESDPPKYGFYYFEGILWFKWNRKTKSIALPWNREFIRYSRLKADQTWETEYAGERRQLWDTQAFPEGHFWQQTVPYSYTLKSGAVQQCQATISVEEREWRPLGTRWLPIFRMIRRVINVEFSQEMGERAGSWKGGTVGCNHEIKPGETPLDTLRRMERERTF